MPIRSPAYFLQHAHPPRRFLRPFFVPFLLFYFSPAFRSAFLSDFALFTGHRASALSQSLSTLLLFLFFLFFISLFPVPFGARFPFLAVFQYGLQRLCVFPPFRLARLSLGFIKGRFPPCCACRRALPFSASLFWPRLPCFAFLQNIVTQSPAPARLLSFSLLLSGRFCSFYRSQGSCLFQTLSALLLLPSSFAFSRALFLLFRFGARFSSLLASYTAFQSAFLSVFCPRFSVPFYICPFFQCPLFITLFPKKYLPPCCAYRRAISTVLLFNLIPLLSYLARPAACFSCFLILAVSSYQRLLWQSRFLRSSRPTFPLRASFLRTKKPAHSPVFSL